MNRLLLSLLLVVSVSSAVNLYSLDVDRSGISSVTLSMQGSGSVVVPMPSDAAEIRMVGGSYALSNGSAVVTAGQSGFTTFSYTSSLLTSKTADGWKLAIDPPNGTGVLVYLPPYSEIDTAYPAPKSVSADSSRAVLQYDSPGQLTIYYRLSEQPAQQQADQGTTYIVAALIAVAIVAAALIMRPLSRATQPAAQPQAPPGQQPAPSAPAERTPTLDLTAGKKEMMETFNENDLKIVGFLLGASGKARRNELERKTGVSKSSLAMALNRLEKRKIIEIDRTATTHFVRLSDYFLRL